MAKRSKNEALDAEKEAMLDAEPALTDAAGDQNVDEEQVEAHALEAGADADSVIPAEAAAVHVDTEAAEAASGERPVKRPSKKTPADRIVAKVQNRRSVKYQAAIAKRSTTTALSLTVALAEVKATSYTKFDGTVELHARLIPSKKQTDAVRGLVQLPHGTPNAAKAVVLTEALIDEIAVSKRADADLYLATPALMPKVAKVAKILGPQGKMPNPKTGTVTDTPEATIEEIESGRVEYRSDAQGIIHVGIGKVSWDLERLVGNAEALIGAIGATRLRSVTVTSTMGPGIQVDLGTLV